MISHSFSKEEDITKESVVKKINSQFLEKMSLISYFAGEELIVGNLLATLCLFSTFTKILGTFTFFVNFEGIAKNPFMILMKIFNRTYFLLDYNDLFKLTVVLMFILNFIFVILFFVILFSTKPRENSTFILSLIKIYQLMSIINFWILLSWEIEMSLLILTGVEKEVAFYKIISVLNIIITFFSSILYCFFGNKVEFNFELCDYFSRLDTSCEFYIFICKLIFSINFSTFIKIGDKDYNPNIYLAICCFISIVMAYCITSFSFYYYNYINMLFLYFNLSGCYSSIVSIVIYNVGTLDGGDFMIIVGYVVFYPVSQVLIQHYWNSLLSKIPFVEIKKEHALCKYMLMLIYLVCVENLSEVERLKLIGVVKQHQQNCVFDTCVCKEENGACLYLPKTEAEYIISNDNFTYETSKIYFKHLIIKEFEFLIKVTRNNNNNNLIMMFSYYMLFYIGNYHTAMYALLNLKKNKTLNYQQKSSLNRIYEMIHHKLEAINSSPMKRIVQNKPVEYFKVDFTNLILFYEKVTKMKISINYALEFAIQFWTCIQNKVEIHLIKKNGLEFYKYHNIIENTYKEIISIYPNLREVNAYYTRYKSAAFNEMPQYYNTAEKGIKNITNTSEEGFLSDNEKFFHPKSVIVIANLTDRNKSIIEKISENVKSLLNYSPTECLGQEVKLLMPNIYKTTHNHFIQTHFETGRNITVNHEKFTFALHANYYSVPVMISVKMLPNYSNNIYYVAVLREVPIDYDFIITTNNGKIEMISKGIFNKIFNNVSISLFNSIDYYIGFICKEYFAEIANINDPKYKITNFTSENDEKKKYKYTLLHFRSDAIIDSILREYKKNENNSNTAYMTTQQSLIDSPIMKILSMKEKIFQNFMKDSIKRYVKIEPFNIFLNDYLTMFKLYQNINADGDVNLDEIKLINQYIYQKEDDVEDPYQNVRLLYGKPEPNESKKKNVDLTLYNNGILIKKELLCETNLFYVKSEKKEKDSENIYSTSIEIKQYDKEQFKVYMSMKKRYKQKKEYGEIKFIILWNLIFLICLIIATSINYASKEKQILTIFKCLQKEYSSIVSIFDNFASLDKNFLLIANRNKYFSSLQNDTEYIDYLYNNSLNTIIELNQITSTLNTLTYDFSDTFLDFFSTNLTFTNKGYTSLNRTLENYIISLISLFNTIDSIDKIDSSNVNIENILTNLNLQFYNQIGATINFSLNSTVDHIDHLKRDNKVNISIFMGLIFLFGVYVYARILCFYCIQNNMIGLLLSIDYDECDNILRLIRELRAISQRRQNDTESKKNTYNNDNESDMLLNKDNETEMNNSKELIQGDKINDKEYEKKITKLVFEQAKKNKKNLRKKSEKKLSNKSILKKANSIPTKVYIVFLVRILFIMLLNLIPFIITLSYRFYEDKSTKIINLIQNLNVNHHSFLISYVLFIKLIMNPSPPNDYTVRLNYVLSLMKSNQFNTTSLFFEALEGFDSMEDFEVFFTKNMCNKSETPERYCNDSSPYYEQSFLYITNINIELIEDIILNSDILSLPSKTDIVINQYLHDERVIMADETFNLLSIYGFQSQRIYLNELISIFVDKFRKQQIIIFIFNIAMMVLNQIVSIYLMKHIIEVVDVELKNIFSLMPFPLALEDHNIKDLLSK